MSETSNFGLLGTLIERLNNQASENGCYGEFGDEPCFRASPDDLTEWCPYCLMQEASKLLAAPQYEIDAARELIRKDAAFQEWAQGYLNSARWAGHDRSDAIKTELLERDAELAALKATLPPPTPTAWLVELGCNPPQWWTGRGDEWTPYVDGTASVRGNGADSSIRFARRQDAERAIGWLLNKDVARGCKVTEHVWLALPPAPPQDVRPLTTRERNNIGRFNPLRGTDIELHDPLAASPPAQEQEPKPYVFSGGIPSQCGHAHPEPPHHRCHFDHGHAGPHETGHGRWEGEYPNAKPLAALPPAHGWQPISTAPKDGTRVLAWNEKWTAPATAQFYGSDWRQDYVAGPFSEQPTHWMPLTDPSTAHGWHAEKEQP